MVVTPIGGVWVDVLSLHPPPPPRSKGGGPRARSRAAGEREARAGSAGPASPALFAFVMRQSYQ